MGNPASNYKVPFFFVQQIGKVSAQENLLCKKGTIVITFENVYAEAACANTSNICRLGYGSSSASPSPCLVCVCARVVSGLCVVSLSLCRVYIAVLPHAAFSSHF